MLSGRFERTWLSCRRGLPPTLFGGAALSPPQRHPTCVASFVQRLASLGNQLASSPNTLQADVWQSDKAGAARLAREQDERHVVDGHLCRNPAHAW
jgi:hypothetical protein